MLPVVVIGLTLSFSGSGSDETLVTAPLADFEEECRGQQTYNGVTSTYEFAVVNKDACKWKAGDTTGYCFPQVRRQYQDKSKYVDVPVSAVSCLEYSKSKCPRHDSATSQHPGGCYTIEDLGTFYRWQHESPSITVDSVTNGWVADNAITEDQCRQICILYGGVYEIEDSTVKAFSGVNADACTCKYTFGDYDSTWVPCKSCGASHTVDQTEMRHTPNFHAALGGSLGGLFLALGYIVILSR